MLIEKLYVPEMAKITGHHERRQCALALIQMLTDAPHLLPFGQYNKHWYASVLTHLLLFAINPISIVSFLIPRNFTIATFRNLIF